MGLKIEKLFSLSQEALMRFCYIYLRHIYKRNEIVKTEDYLYAKGDIPILLVAHLDIVHKQLPQTIVYDRQQRILWSPTGIGGDDRCGVYALLKICTQFKPYVLFTTDEEKGGLGVRKFVEQNKSLPVNFIIEVDRRGNKQAVFYECGNKEFQNYILDFGFDEYIGSYSDVSTLSVSYDIAGCNLSAGYYNEHTNTEHIFLDHLDYTISKIKEILSDTENHKFYNCQKVERYYRNKNYKYNYDYWDDFYDYEDEYEYDDVLKKYVKKVKSNEIEEKTEFTEVDKMLQKEDDFYSLSPEEWKKKYKTEKPNNVIDIYDNMKKKEYAYVD